MHNGSVSNDELSAASVLARLGVTVDAHGGLVSDRPASLLSGRIGINNKENVMDEPKEEDEKKTADVRCRAHILLLSVPQTSLMLHDMYMYMCYVWI